MRQPDERGFTLLELLVALAVFSLAVMALLNLVAENIRTAGALEARVIARVVADNRAVEVLTAVEPPAPGEAQGEERAAGRTWRWTRLVSPTDDPDILRVDIAVRGEGLRQAMAESTVFRGRR